MGYRLGIILHPGRGPTYFLPSVRCLPLNDGRSASIPFNIGACVKARLYGVMHELEEFLLNLSWGSRFTATTGRIEA